MKKRKTKTRKEFWCLPQADGHPTIYFHGHDRISRAEYVHAVGPDDCEPHVATTRRRRTRRRS